MTKTEEFETLLDKVEKASDEIRRLKDVLKLQLMHAPDQPTEGLDTAIRYWEQRKTEVEEKLRLLK